MRLLLLFHTLTVYRHIFVCISSHGLGALLTGCLIYWLIEIGKKDWWLAIVNSFCVLWWLAIVNSFCVLWWLAIVNSFCVLWWLAIVNSFCVLVVVSFFMVVCVIFFHGCMCPLFSWLYVSSMLVIYIYIYQDYTQI
jgi:hypothetical protein